MIALVVALVATGVLGGLYSVRNGRVRELQVPPPPADSVASADPTAAALRALVALPGERATLLQFSTAFCAPCRATRRILGEVAELVPGVVHVEVDAESHLEAVRTLDVRRTPTVLVLDGDLRPVRRASGQPRRDEVLATLAGLLPESSR